MLCDGCEELLDTRSTPAGNLCASCQRNWEINEAEVDPNRSNVCRIKLPVDFSNKTLYN